MVLWRHAAHTTHVPDAATSGLAVNELDCGPPIHAEIVQLHSAFALGLPTRT